MTWAEDGRWVVPCGPLGGFDEVFFFVKKIVVDMAANWFCLLNLNVLFCFGLFFVRCDALIFMDRFLLESQGFGWFLMVFETCLQNQYPVGLRYLLEGAGKAGKTFIEKKTGKKPGKPLFYPKLL